MFSAIESKSAIVLLIAAILLCLAVVHAQVSSTEDIRKDLQKQDEIYRSQGGAVPKGYVTTRALAHYDELLPHGFPAVREALGPNGRWLDIGAGSGQAIVDFALRTRIAPQDDDYAEEVADARGRLVAISIEDRRLDAWRHAEGALRANEIRYIHGKRLRELAQEDLGRFDMITDVYGGFSYTDDLSAFTEKVLSFLDAGGSFFTVIQSVHLADGRERQQTWFLTEIADAAGRDVTPCAWLKRITCVEVECDSKSTWDPATELITVRKLCETTAVPQLIPISYEAGTPPGRKFLLASP